ncbi:unnamed protein product [Triticum turgidum subsp. durum]|uniref:RRM domain-containing protein n=1 Tax=Triticum turgidum subsp. durum TaxID=4567 RepID=A0A9R0V2Y0_TRITD|nr:unnamed protein product [Triticum turgidum subsp. durum]
MRKGMAPPSPLPPRAAGLLGSPPRCVRVRRRCHRHHARPVFSVHPFLGSPASAFLPASNPRLLPTPQLHRRSRHHRRLHEPAGAEEHPLHRWTGGGGGEKILHAVFVPFRENKGVKRPLDQATQKHCSFGFFTFLERENTATAMDNMDGAEFFGRELRLPRENQGRGAGMGCAARYVPCFSSVQLRHALLSCLRTWLLDTRVRVAKCFSYLV